LARRSALIRGSFGLDCAAVRAEWQMIESKALAKSAGTATNFAGKRKGTGAMVAFF